MVLRGMLVGPGASVGSVRESRRFMEEWYTIQCHAGICARKTGDIEGLVCSAGHGNVVRDLLPQRECVSMLNNNRRPQQWVLSFAKSL